MKFVFTPKFTFANIILCYITFRTILKVKNKLNKSINKPWEMSHNNHPKQN